MRLALFDADSFNGRTWDFDSQNRGSTPRSVANDPEGLAFGVLIKTYEELQKGEYHYTLDPLGRK